MPYSKKFSLSGYYSWTPYHWELGLGVYVAPFNDIRYSGMTQIPAFEISLMLGPITLATGIWRNPTP